MRPLNALILIPALITACSSSSSSPTTKVNSPANVKEIYRECGLPRSSQFDPDIQGVPAQQTPATTTPPSKVATTKVETPEPIPVETLPATNPWEDNNPVSPEEGQSYVDLAQRANEVYQEAKDSTDAKEARKLYLQSAELYISSTRIPDDTFRNNSLYNAACCYSLIGDKANALKYLRLSLQFGFDDFNHIAKDVDFDPIRTDEDFQKLIAEFQGPAPKKLVPETPRPEPAPENAPVIPTDRQLMDMFEAADKLYGEKKYIEAAAMYAASSQLLSIRANALYNAACCFALAGEKAKAVEALRRAISVGYNNYEHLKSDPDLDSIRSMPEYIELLKGK
ncbi:MAG: hypothetical protein AB7F75_00025 [Planctomycetota bacterium]